MPDVLSKDAEQKIITAVKTAMELVDDKGMVPDTAMAKMARDCGWGSDMIEFAGRAYNTARQAAQRRSSDEVLEKFATFPLVNPTAVVASVFPTKEAVIKTAMAIPLPAAVLPNFPRWNQHRAPNFSIKIAMAPVNPPASRPTVTQTFNQFDRFRAEAGEARRKAAAAQDRLINQVGDLEEYFLKYAGDRLPFSHVEMAATVYHGDAVKPLLEHVYRQCRLKEARYNPAKPPLTEYVAGDRPYTLIAACVKTAAAVADNRESEKTAVDRMEAYAINDLAPLVAVPKIIKGAADSIIPDPDKKFWDRDSVRAFLPPLPREVIKQAAAIEPSAWSLLDGIDKQAGAEGGAMAVGGTLLADKLMSRDPGGDDRVSNAYRELADPLHQSQLQQIRTQAMLADLMNDEVIGDGNHSPDEIAHAFNEISQLAPRAAQNPLAIRGMLRRYLEQNGNIENTEIQQMAGTDQALKGLQTPLPEHLSAVPAPSGNAPVLPFNPSDFSPTQTVGGLYSSLPKPSDLTSAVSGGLSAVSGGLSAVAGGLGLKGSKEKWLKGSKGSDGKQAASVSILDQSMEDAGDIALF
jgi:hypothetical protein